MKKYLFGTTLILLGFGALIYALKTENGYEWRKAFLLLIAAGNILNIIRCLSSKYAPDRRMYALEEERLRGRMIQISLGISQEMEAAAKKDRDREERWKKSSGENIFPKKS